LLMLALEIIALGKEEEMLRDGLLIIKTFRIKFCIFILESKKIMINEMDDERFNLIHRLERAKERIAGQRLKITTSQQWCVWSWRRDSAFL
jgi:hypothetical protein